MLRSLALAINRSPMHDAAQYVLRNVPGFPPIIQTVHLAGIALVMGSVVLVNLRLVGLALPRQPATDLARRLLPVLWWTLPVLIVSGGVFVCAQPRRYFTNPVFGIKFALLLPALALALFIHRASRRTTPFWDRSPGGRVAAGIIGGCSLILWTGVALAGRWIAYVDYLFPDR